MNPSAADRIVDLYREGADDWIAARSSLGQGDMDDIGWLDRFMAMLPPDGSVLDVGCGHGHPIGAALIARGFRVIGIDTSEALIAHARMTLPNGDWRVGDLRTFDLDTRFDGLIAWCSLFHLTMEDQSRALPPLLRHGAVGATVLFNAGPAESEAIGEWRGEPLYHASLAPEAYRAILEAEGYIPDAASTAAEPSVWLAQRALVSAE